MTLLHDIAAGLFWLGVIGGGLAFLAWVGDRLHARDGESFHPLQPGTGEGVVLLRTVGEQKFVKPFRPGEDMVAALRSDEGWILDEEYLPPLLVQDSPRRRARDVEDPASDTVD